MSKAFQRDLMTLGVLGIGGYLIYTKTDWFQQSFDVIKDILKDLGINVGDLGFGSKGSSSGDLGATGECGKTVYQATGKTWAAKDSGKTKRNYRSGKQSTGTTQWDTGTVGPVANLELTTYLNVGKCGDNVSIKAWGPNHSNGKCCWGIVNVDCKSGKFSVGMEGNHPTTNNSVKGGSSMGSIQGKKVGVKMAIWKSGSTIHIEGYGSTGSSWQKYVEWSGSEVGVKNKKSSPDSGARGQFRIDCRGVNIDCAIVSEINPPGSSSSKYVSAGQYTSSLFTNNSPIPVGYYNSRLIDASNEPYCELLPKGFRGPCYDGGDNDL